MLNPATNKERFVKAAQWLWCALCAGNRRSTKIISTLDRIEPFELHSVYVFIPLSRDIQHGLNIADKRKFRLFSYPCFEGKFFIGDKMLEDEINVILCENRSCMLLTKCTHHQSTETLITAKMRGHRVYNLPLMERSILLLHSWKMQK